MRIRKTDKIIIEKFFPGKDLKLIQKDEEHNFRFYHSKDGTCGMAIGGGEACIKSMIYLFLGLMDKKKHHIDIVITNYDNLIIVLFSGIIPFRIEREK